MSIENDFLISILLTPENAEPFQVLLFSLQDKCLFDW